MSTPRSVIIGAIELLDALSHIDAVEGEVISFSDHEPLKALQAITTGRPTVIALERLFAAIARSMSEYSRSCPGYEPLVGDLIPQAYESDKKHLALTAPTGTLRRIAPPGE